MRKIEAVIKPSKLDAVRQALHDLGITGMTLLEVKGYGRQKGHREVYRGTEYELELIPKIQVQILVDTVMADEVVSVIQRTARTGKIGDGKIFVSSVKEVFRIRTGETGKDAL